MAVIRLTFTTKHGFWGIIQTHGVYEFKLMPSERKSKLLTTLSKGKDPITRV